MSKLSMMMIGLIGILVFIMVEIVFFFPLPQGQTRKIEECPTDAFEYQNSIYEPLCIELATSMQKRARGLMHVKSMPENYGLLFVFDEPQLVKFWMRNTPISLDMIFLDENFCVEKIEPFTTPYSLEEITSNNTKFVLEINAGLSEKFGFIEGTCEKPMPPELFY